MNAKLHIIIGKPKVSTELHLIIEEKTLTLHSFLRS